jgi:glycosyltransferase involved in cell wall biosynthesis
MGNGIDLDFYQPQVKPSKADAVPLIVFTGQMDYRPNVEAVASFTHDAMPQILAQYPKTRFAIVGRAPTAAVQKLHGVHNAEVIGAVDDVRDWLSKADVVVAPLRIARGIQNKVLEAMAMAKPVVASTAAAEGLMVTDGSDLLVAQDPAQEAAHVLSLLNDRRFAAQMGQTARQTTERQYSWNSQLALLGTLFPEPCLAEAAE